MGPKINHIVSDQECGRPITDPTARKDVSHVNDPETKPEPIPKPYKKPTGKMTKKEARRIAKSNMKMDGWLKNETIQKKKEKLEINTRRLEEEIEIDMEWTDPVLEQEREIKKKEALRKRNILLTKLMVKDIVNNLVEETPARSEVAKIMDIVVKESSYEVETNMIWNKLLGNDVILRRIRIKLEDMAENERLEKEVAMKAKRLENRNKKEKEWKEKKNMMDLLCGMESLGLGSFEGEWDEHNAMDDWMMEALLNGHLLDDDIIMDVAHKDEKAEDTDMLVDEFTELVEPDDEMMSTFEDWLEKELCDMDVDGGTRELVFGNILSKLQHHGEGGGGMRGTEISENAYYGGGTWYLNGWLAPPAERGGRGENYDHVQSEDMEICDIYDSKGDITMGDISGRKRSSRPSSSRMMPNETRVSTVNTRCKI